MIIGFEIGYGALYKADEERDVDEEKNIFGVPLRYISHLGILPFRNGFFLLNAMVTFDAHLYIAGRVVTIASIFSVIGAAAVDSILWSKHVFRP